MSHRLLQALGPQILADLARNNLMGASPSANDLKSKQNKLSKSAQAPSGEDMDARLRSIRRYITPRELAALLHWDIGTVYRKIKAGMPADRDVDAQGRGNRIKIYPPQVADWRRDCSEALRRPNQLTSSLPVGDRGDSEAGRVVELTKRC
jgi:hypothetical protein